MIRIALALLLLALPAKAQEWAYEGSASSLVGWPEILASYTLPGEWLALTNLSDINKAVNKATYVPEEDGRDDWQGPMALYQHGGDCEDYAIAKFLLFRRLGITGQIWVLEGHAVFVVEGIVLDNRTDEVYDVSQLPEPLVYAFDDRHAWLTQLGVDMADRELAAH